MAVNKILFLLLAFAFFAQQPSVDALKCISCGGRTDAEKYYNKKDTKPGSKESVYEGVCASPTSKSEEEAKPAVEACLQAIADKNVLESTDCVSANKRFTAICTDQNTACYKSTITYLGTEDAEEHTRIERGCGPIPGLFNEGDRHRSSASSIRLDCTKIPSNAHKAKDVEVCGCDSDGCNGGEYLHGHPLFFILLLLIPFIASQ